MRLTTYLFLRLTVWLFSFLPFSFLYFLAGLLRLVLFGLFQYRAGVVKANLKNSFPEKPASEISSLARHFYRHFCDLLLESIKGLSMNKAEIQRRFVYRNPEIFTPFFDKKQSVILLGSHYGNWEWGVLSFPLAVRQTVVGIYKPLKNKWLDAWLRQRRTRWGLQLVNMKLTGREIERRKNETCIFVFIADQTPSDLSNAHWVNFLHQDTPFLQGVDKIARQTGYPVFMFHVHRMRRGHYEVQFEEVCSHIRMAQVGDITRSFAGRLEAVIRENPSDWLWSHRRWKRKRTDASFNAL